jgi:ankyrin repeat protein
VAVWNRIRLLSNKNADVALTENDGRTALIRAAAYGKHKCIQLLLGANVDVNQGDGVDGWGGLHWACHTGHPECLRLLIKNKADVNCEEQKAWTGA